MAMPASYNENELIQIIEDYLHGQDLETIRFRLKIRCKPIGAVACYQAITSHQTPYTNALNKIFDDLSIGGSILHQMPHNTALTSGFFNCYVLNPQNQLIYINSNKTIQNITFIDEEKKRTAINHITVLHGTKTSFHLTANQIKQLITENTVNEHIPNAKDLQQIEYYKSHSNLYLALKSVSKQHTHLNALIDVINETTPEQNWLLSLLSVTGLIAITAGFIYFLKENIEQVQLWLEQTISLLDQWINNALHLIRSTPLIGILSHGLPLLNAWYQLLFSNTPTDGNRVITVLFKTIEHALPIVGFILCYLAAGTMTEKALTLFITGAVFEIVHTLYTVLNSEYNRQVNPLPPSSAGDYHSIVATLRADNQYEQGLWTFLIKFFANLISTTLVVIWCVYPPTLAIALSCSAIGALVGQIKSMSLSYLKNHYAEQLQQNICNTRERLNMNMTNNGIEQYEQMIHELSQENQTLQRTILELQELNQRSYQEGFRVGHTQGFNQSINNVTKPDKTNSTRFFKPPAISKNMIKQLNKKANTARATVANTVVPLGGNDTHALTI